MMFGAVLRFIIGCYYDNNRRKEFKDGWAGNKNHPLMDYFSWVAVFRSSSLPIFDNKLRFSGGDTPSAGTGC
jgi:hypothetical protein